MECERPGERHVPRSSFLKYGENTRGDSFSRLETHRFGFALRQAALLAMRAILSQISTLALSGITGSTKAISAATANTTVFPASAIDQIGANSFAKGHGRVGPHAAALPRPRIHEALLQLGKARAFHRRARGEPGKLGPAAAMQTPALSSISGWCCSLR